MAAVKLTKDQILAALPGLDAEGLRAIRAAAEGLLSRGAVEAGGSTDPQVWLFEALQAVLNVRYGRAWLNGPSGKIFRKNAPIVLEFLGKYFPDIMVRKVSAQAMMRWLIEMIVDTLKSMGVPVSTTGVIKNFVSVDRIFNDAFPGYLNSGLAYMIAAQIIEREPHEIL